jgi:hypothetical protein
MGRTTEVLAQQQADDQIDNGGAALVPVDTSDDGWTGAAAEAESRWLQGSLIQFADWQWTMGSEKTEIEKGRQLVAVGVRSVWVRWEIKKPVCYRAAPPGHLLPSRESLGDHDKDKWERDPKGEPKDPWANTRYVYLLDPKTAEMLTFSTSSSGGRRCVEDLATAIGRMRREHPGATPVVALEAAPKPTPFGRKSRPVLKVVDWRFPAEPEHKVVEAAPALTPPATTAPPVSAARTAAGGRVADDMDDIIPF